VAVALSKAFYADKAGIIHNAAFALCHSGSIEPKPVRIIGADVALSAACWHS
jgi:hypothetical protein